MTMPAFLRLLARCITLALILMGLRRIMPDAGDVVIYVLLWSCICLADYGYSPEPSKP